MKVEILVAVAFCAGLVHSHPLGDSSFLDLGDDKTEPVLAAAAAAKDGPRSEEGYDNDRLWDSTLRKLRQGSGANVNRLDMGRSHSAGGRLQKRPFGETSSWNSLGAPDPFFNPIHLQNWGSQFGRNYRAFDGGHQSTGRLRPAHSGLYTGGAGLFGEDALQDWRALYHNDRF